MLDPRLRDLLVCPSCRGPLRPHPDRLVCVAESLAYPIVDGVPHLLIERARRERRGRDTEPPEEQTGSVGAPPAADPQNA